jgi:hypothetical protein
MHLKLRKGEDKLACGCWISIRLRVKFVQTFCHVIIFCHITTSYIEGIRMVTVGGEKTKQNHAHTCSFGLVHPTWIQQGMHVARCVTASPDRLSFFSAL